MIRAHAVKKNVTPVRVAIVGLALTMSGCSTVENFLGGEKLDYRTQAHKTSPLEVPPDLTQLARDARYQPQSGVVSANALQKQGAAAPASNTAANAVAPNALGDFRIERQGSQRWLVTSMPADKLWPQLRQFWQDRGFALSTDQPEIGLMETEWGENRAKLPQDFIRKALGSLLDSLYSTGERDRFRTRVERTASGTEVYITHRGMQEVYSSERKESTIWQPRPSDPQLEAEFLSRLLVKLGAKEEVAKATVTQAQPDQPSRARIVAGQPGATIEVDDNFDRTWRRVGVGLDRSGFTVEDRDRTAGLYFVRYVDPKLADKDEPGFFSKLFGGDKDKVNMLQRFRVVVKAAGTKTTVTVQNSAGAADNGEAAQAIVKRLADELK